MTHIDAPNFQRTSLIAQAVRLQESGILIHGMEVTDLSTGYTRTGPAHTQVRQWLAFTPPRKVDGPDQVPNATQHAAMSGAEHGDQTTRGGGAGLPQDYPYRNTGLSLARLETLRDLLVDVVAQREDNAQWASVNPPVPRKDFPWGLGLEQPDVLITTTTFGAQGIRAYLRQHGYRARCVDPNPAISILADLREAEMSNACPVGVDESPVADESQVSSSSASNAVGAEFHDEPSEPTSARRVFVLVAGAIALIALAGIAAIVLPGSAQPTGESIAAGDPPHAGVRGGDAGASGEVGTATPTRSEVAPTSQAPAETTAFAEHRKSHDAVIAPAADRADIPVTISVDGWRRVGATKGREEFRSDDPDMRILVAAKPAPVESQQRLDQAVLSAIEQAQGQAAEGRLEVVGTAPAVYREIHDGSQTKWTVRLVEGHQVSIGCQTRTGVEVPPRVEDSRVAACAAAIDTARVEK